MHWFSTMEIYMAYGVRILDEIVYLTYINVLVV